MDHIPLETLLRLKRWNTPTIYNGWEAITRADRTTCFNREPLVDYMPEMGPMAGFAVTVVIQPSEKSHATRADAWNEYRRYVASVPGPKIVVVQDLDKPVAIGAFWGEVNSSAHRALGCVGTITDGAIRDLDEMCDTGFKAIARGLCVGHAWSVPVRWNCEVSVFGCTIKPGQLIHADKHGFLAVPLEDETRLLDAAAFLDQLECETVIPAAKDNIGLNATELIARLDEAGKAYTACVRERFGTVGEWVGRQKG
ncbi:MAG: dimethylmenaquinone methyltransferase [Spirochaetes bacterium RIFOXYC1_FULL_54_7]|nr:MAG: dimethylmenaquinone methyltransferase [Spirochaetes bacterium RIFOXYC1_FULL_54_7]